MFSELFLMSRIISKCLFLKMESPSCMIEATKNTKIKHTPPQIITNTFLKLLSSSFSRLDTSHTYDKCMDHCIQGQLHQSNLKSSSTSGLLVCTWFKALISNCPLLYSEHTSSNSPFSVVSSLQPLHSEVQVVLTWIG